MQIPVRLGAWLIEIIVINNLYWIRHNGLMYSIRIIL